jgi:hypothetical protein
MRLDSRSVKVCSKRLAGAAAFGAVAARAPLQAANSPGCSALVHVGQAGGAAAHEVEAALVERADAARCR